MPVMNLQKNARLKKGGTAMRKRVTKKDGGMAAKSPNYYKDKAKSPRDEKRDEITRDNERFIAGKIANEVMKLFVDPETKKQIGRIQEEDIPNTFLETIRKGMGATKKARGGTVQKSVAKKKGGMAFKPCKGCPAPAKCKAAGKCLKKS